MLVVVASRHDATAEALVGRWGNRRARLVTPADLSNPGWQYRPGAPATSTAVVAGQVVPAGEITGVLTRLPHVAEDELEHIAPADRAYVAAEMTAFLLAWLSGLPRPVLNRPAPGCLAGPGWGPEQWVAAAARAGVPVRPVRRRIALAAAGEPEAPEPVGAAVTIVGERWFGAVDARLAAQARRVADAAGVDLLAARFAGPEAGAPFLGAGLWPDVAAPDVAEAIAGYLSRDGRR